MNKPSGVAALDWDGGKLRVAQLDRLDQPEDVLRWVASEAREDTGIGIDAPIVIPNETGMRQADRLAHSLYGRYHAGAYPASRARSFWRRTTGLSEALVKIGFGHGDSLGPRCSGRFQIEVHPHAAAVQLFVLHRIVQYKRGRLAERRAGLERLRGLMLDRLPRLTPAVELGVLPGIPSRGRELKAVEDQLDAFLAAYVAAHWWYWGRERNEVLGDSIAGYIIVPHRSTSAGLDEADLDRDPIAQFQKWFDQAREAGNPEPSAMTLATVSSDGQPSARMVLLRGVDRSGFVFFTNYRSRKGRELARNPKAALVFYWPELSRQVRITGQVSNTTREESEAYFQTRPRGSQIGAWASWQSSSIADREVLDARVRKLTARFEGKAIPAPANWGGFRLMPDSIEFWQGRANRLHDRLRYSRSSGKSWKIERLAP